MSTRIVINGGLIRLVISFLIVALIGISLGSCSAGTGANLATNCVPVSADAAKSSDVVRSFDGGIQGVDWVRVWKSGPIHITRGMFVGLELIEPMEPPGYVIRRAGFPWTHPRLSSERVLKSARQCHPSAPSAGLQVVVYYFQGVATGTVTATAPLSEGWSVQSTEACANENAPHCVPLEPLRVTVIVT